MEREDVYSCSRRIVFCLFLSSSLSAKEVITVSGEPCLIWSAESLLSRFSVFVFWDLKDYLREWWEGEAFAMISICFLPDFLDWGLSLILPTPSALSVLIRFFLSSYEPKSLFLNFLVCLSLARCFYLLWFDILLESYWIRILLSYWSSSAGFLFDLPLEFS